MFLSLERHSFGKALLPECLIKFVMESVDSSTDLHMCAVARLVTQVVLRAIKAFNEKDYKLLDANPGDGGCQNRAIILLELTKTNFGSLDGVLKKAGEVDALITKRKQTKQNLQPQLFFGEHFLEKRDLTPEMEYIFRCYLLTAIRSPYQTLPNGVVMTRSDSSRLSRLSKDLDKIKPIFRKKIVEENQAALSILSMQAMRFLAAKQNNSLTTLMLSPEHTHIFSPNSDEFEPKAFGCLFYSVKTVLSCLRERQEIAFLKTIVPEKKESYHILLKSKISGEELEIMDDESISLFPKETGVVVFEAVVDVDRCKAKELIQEHGFSRIVLMGAAREAPYEPSSKLEDMGVKEAIDEVGKYKEMTDGEPFHFDHVYLTTLNSLVRV